MSLDPAVDAEHLEVATRTGRVHVYAAGPGQDCTTNPLLLVHTVNAAASVKEVAPLFEHFRTTRCVYAPDLPGFGLSDRPAQRYEPETMCEALERVVETIRGRHDGARLDVMAVSLSCEFAVRVALRATDAFSTLALVSPTAMNGAAPPREASAGTRGSALAHAVLGSRAIGGPLFALLTTRASIGFFLRKTFGSDAVPPDLIDYAHATSHQAGARHAPVSFLSGYLFSRDAYAMYERLALPVWLCHGVRGDFQDYRLAASLCQRPGWSRLEMSTGALPYFEAADEFVNAYEAFLASNARR